MTVPARPRPEVGWWRSWLCALLGHSYPTRLYEYGNERCDCPADHTYPGCARCGAHMNVEEWW